jgi:PAS domain S-box-containing protein
VVDADFAVIEFNPAAEEITGRKRSEVIGRRCAEVFSTSLCTDNCPLRESDRTGLPCLGREVLIRTKGGEELPVIFSSRAVHDESGTLLCGIEVFRDATYLRQLETHKRNLISLFTHDLKAPVSIIGGFVDRLVQGKAGELNEKQARYLETIHKEITRLEQYIFSFLDIARIESGQLELQLKPCAFGELLREIVTGFEIRASENQIRLQLEIHRPGKTIAVDRVQISRVVSNLLDNAIKYSREKSTVHIILTHRPQQMILEIRDQGPGISVQEQGKIFTHFYRINDERRVVQGTGLGLAAVKAIVEAHAGRVWVHSIPGEGSSFFIALPTGS